MTTLVFQIFVCHFPNQFITHLPLLENRIINFKLPISRQKRSFIVDSGPDVHQLTVSTSTFESSPESSFTVQFLINSCGFSLKEALSASQKFQLHEHKSQHYDSVISYLKSYGFIDAHIKKLILWFPQILKATIHTTLKPKLEYLAENGFVGPLLPDLIMASPVFLFRSLDHHIKPTIQVLQKYIRTNERIVRAAKRCTWILNNFSKKVVQENVEFLISEGVTPNTIDSMITWQPRSLLMNFDKYVKAVEICKKIGLDPASRSFIEAILLLASIKDSTWKKKYQLLMSLGWTEEDIVTAFKRDPRFLNGSEEKVRSIMDFFLNTVKLTPSDLTAYPQVLRYSLSLRLRPRYNVLQILMAKDLIRPNKILWMFALPEKQFLTNYVHKYLDQVPNLMHMYLVEGDEIDVQPTKMYTKKSLTNMH